MSARNVQILRQALERAVDHPEALYEILDPAVKWDVSGQLPDGTATTGIDGVRGFFRRWVGTFEEFRFEIEEMIDAGDEVFVILHQYGVGKGSGALVGQRFPQVWTFRDGKVVRHRGFRERADALRAAGLRE